MYGSSYEVNTYLEQQIATASPAQLVDMLFDRACRDLTGARDLLHLDPRSASQALRLVVHAQEIVAALNSALNFREGGDLARNLGRIYEYIQYRLTAAVEKREAESVSEALELLQELHEAWHTITLRTQAEATAEQPGGLNVSFLVA